MIKRKSNLIFIGLWITAFFSLHVGCIAQKTTIIQGSLNAEGFNEIRIKRYSPDMIIQKRLLFPVNDGKFEIPFDIQKPEIIRIFNNYILISPNKTYKISIEGSDLKIISEGFNKALISKEVDYENLSKRFWYDYEKTFDIIKYKNMVDSISENSINTLIKSKKFVLSKDEKAAILNYISSKDIFYYSIPFVSDNISGTVKKEMAKIIFKKIVNFGNTSFEDRSEDFDNAISNFYIKWLYREAKVFSKLLQGEYWNINPKLKKIVAGQFIQAYANNKIVLNKTELIILKKIMCEDDPSKFEFCDYYTNKIEYRDLLLDSIAKNDYLVSSEDSFISLPILFHNKNSYVYFWASWCVPCINFIKRLDMKKLEKDSSFALVFLSIDDNKEAWKKTNLSLGVAAPTYLIKDGLKSGFTKRLQIDHVPFVININNNRIDKLNVPKDVFSKYLK